MLQSFPDLGTCFLSFQDTANHKFRANDTIHFTADNLGVYKVSDRSRGFFCDSHITECNPVYVQATAVVFVMRVFTVFLSFREEAGF